jgi:hypothetical protein
MDEERYYQLRTSLIWFAISLGCLWIVVMGQKSDFLRLRTAFAHFVTCPRCRAGQTINPETQAKAEAGHES